MVCTMVAFTLGAAVAAAISVRCHPWLPMVHEVPVPVGLASTFRTDWGAASGRRSSARNQGAPGPDFSSFQRRVRLKR
jgi:hypothetical protein